MERLVSFYASDVIRSQRQPTRSNEPGLDWRIVDCGLAISMCCPGPGPPVPEGLFLEFAPLLQ